MSDRKMLTTIKINFTTLGNKMLRLYKLQNVNVRISLTGFLVFHV